MESILALNNFRNDPGSEARDRRAALLAGQGPAIVSSGFSTTTNLTVDANNLLELGYQTSELAPVAANQTILGIITTLEGQNGTAGGFRKLKFGLGCVLVYDAVNFILPGAASISTVAGDVGIFACLGGTANAQGQWECIQFQRGGVPPNPGNGAIVANAMFNLWGSNTAATDYNYTSAGSGGPGDYLTIPLAAPNPNPTTGFNALGNNILLRLSDGNPVNGVYTYTSGDGSTTPLVWTRVGALNTPQQFVGATIVVISGTTVDLAGIWFCTNTSAPAFPPAGTGGPSFGIGPAVVAAGGGTFNGDNAINMIDGATNTVSHALSICHSNLFANPVAGFGVQFDFALQTSSGYGQVELLAGHRVTWTNSGISTYKGRHDVILYDHTNNNIGMVVISAASDGSGGPLFSVFNAVPVAKQTGDAGTALVTFGFMSGTPTFAATNLTGTTLPAGIVNSSLVAVGNGIVLQTPASGNLANCTGYPGTSVLITVGTVTTGTWKATTISMVANCRLSLSSTLPVTITDSTAATLLYLIPYQGNLVPVYNGTNFIPIAFSSESLAATDTRACSLNGTTTVTLTSGTTTQLVRGMAVTGTDIAANSVIATIPSATTFTMNNAATGTTTATLTFKLPASTVYDVWFTATTLQFGNAWTNSTTPADAISYTNGVYVPNGAINSADSNAIPSGQATYLGSVMTTATVGQLEDSVLNRLVWNYFNRKMRKLVVVEATATWTYQTATWREARGQTTNQFTCLVGRIAEDMSRFVVEVSAANNVGSVNAAVGVGIDSTTANSADVFGTTVGTGGTQLMAVYEGYLAVGYHYIAWLEIAAASNTTTFVSTNSVSYRQAGLVGFVWG